MNSIKIILLLLIISLVINFYSVHEIRTQTVADVISLNKEENYFNKVYDLNNYKSTSYERQNLQQRFDRLYSEYEKDKQIPKEKYYNDRVVKRYWKKKCENSLRRILVITSKIEVLESTINIIIQGNEKSKQDFDLLIEKNSYRDKLLDVSNFYAQFVSDESYENIQKTLD